MILGWMHDQKRCQKSPDENLPTIPRSPDAPHHESCALRIRVRTSHRRLSQALTTMLLSTVAYLAALGSAVSAAGRQAAFVSDYNARAEYFATTGRPVIPPGANMNIHPGFEPSLNFSTMHLSAVQATETFTTLVHPNFSGHQVRIKKTDFCDPTVK